MDDQSENSGRENVENSENENDENLVTEDIPEEGPAEITADAVEQVVPDPDVEASAECEVEENALFESAKDEASISEPGASVDLDLEQLLLDSETTVGDELFEEDENAEVMVTEESKDPKIELRSLEKRFSELEVDGDHAKGSVSKPKYQIKEFLESASNLKFEVVNTNTTFKLFLPTLKKIVEIPEWEKAVLKREQPLIRQAMQRARMRSRDYLCEMTRRDNRMIVSEARHIINYERAQRTKAQVLQRRRGCVKDLTEPPQRCDPRQSFGIKKRPTEHPPMPALHVSTRSKDNKFGARLRCARERYNKRSDDTWLHSEQLKLIRAAERLERCNMFNEKFATPPQEHNPWVLSPKSRKKRPSIPMPLHRY
ncbi:Hypothetical predicted protein [Cloeon dipterum]|uniref:Uncharacterized protein n=1 Tax=Cloeon dipterum TaxID=197152 RepID=A0A8S1CT72_9INSE|nr:Hypothetical predicted protein [Cloeon dipterum]